MHDNAFLVEIERDLEINAIDNGVKRYKENIEGRDPASLSPERRFIQAGMDGLVPAIEKTQEQWLSGEVFIGGQLWGSYLAGLDAKKTALATLAELFNNAGEDNTYTWVAQQVGQAVEQVRQFECIRKGDNHYFHKALAHIPNMTKSRFRLMKRNYTGEIHRMRFKEVLSIGSKLTELAIEHTNLFDYKKYYSRGNFVTEVVLSHEVRKAIETAHEEQSLLIPAYMPMVIPPVPWESETGGGYLYLQSTAVKSVVGLKNDELRRLRAPHIQPVLDALNTLSQTEWKLDHENLECLKAIYYKGGGRAGVPEVDPKEMPPLPPDFDTNTESRKQWIYEAATIHKHNAKLVGQRRLVKSQINVGQTMQNTKVDKFYYTWEADFRMRMYPRSVQLSPQASDSGRGCLLFAQGVPLGEHGRKWLAVGLANSMGHDKVSFSKRVSFVESKAASIKQWVDNPMRYTGWMTMDEPFQGLQFARDWVKSIGCETTYVSHVPVGLDGSCNGMQHFSALSRDPQGAKYTNLTYTEDPESLYIEIADAVNEAVNADCRVMPKFDEEGDLNACFAWQGKVNKQLVKAPTMTKPYGVTSFGVIDQLCDAIKETGIELEGHQGKNMKYMLTCVGIGLREAAQPAVIIMDWLRQVAMIAARANKPLVWNNPDGVPIIQEYPNFADSRVYTAFHSMTWNNPERRDHKCPMSVHKNANSISPNFIHPLDAAHMIRTLRVGVAAGITQYRMIHDSYGVHAGHCHVFHPIIRQTFTDLHRVNWLQKFAEDIVVSTGQELPPIPEVGNFDIEEILKSEFLFH